jgi:hypothetical protein
MKKSEIINKMMEMYKENTEAFNHDIEELDDWNGCLGDERARYMEDLKYYTEGQDTDWLLNRIYFGYDGDSKEGEFCPLREYFYFNAYGSLVSTDYIDYTDRLDEYYVEDIADNAHRLNLSARASYLVQLFEENPEED